MSRAGAGFSQNVGDVVEVDDAEALRMIDAGQAFKIEEVETTEKKVKTEKASGKNKAKK